MNQYFKVILYIHFKLCKQTRSKMYKFEGHLIHIGLGNIFHLLLYAPKYVLMNVQEHCRFLSTFLVSH